MAVGRNRQHRRGRRTIKEITDEAAEAQPAVTATAEAGQREWAF